MKRPERWLAGILLAVLLLIPGCGRSSGAQKAAAEAPLPAEAEITDEELAEATAVYERAAKKYDEKQNSEIRWSTEGMTRIHVAQDKSHATVFYADQTHVLALNYSYEKKSGQYYYAYSVYAGLRRNGMKSRKMEQVPVYNKIPENITSSRSSVWWVSSSVSELERLFKGQNIDAQIELRNAKGRTYWFYCQD